ncbi:MAG TPA: M48 family metalloprotease [Oligoflexus sp.]|uniref:M48 family metalloprotease n=1 Tax=Oligoflexus sp. TaxID=1971216 RepID=UPI002D72CE7E|nr:M48 family metalloprotease [Oligoflexus sp.]HYX33167.1 M48 family metalloprotease [Oligoflexus sp.]
MRNSKSYLALAIVAFAHYSCGASPSSDLKHTYGETTHATATPDLGNCIEQKTSSYPEVRQYLKDIMTKITKANPKTFSGRFSADKFCIEISSSKLVNAEAHASGKIEFNIGLIQAFETDAAVAGIMAHELAHMTMAHQTRVIDDKFSNDPEIKSIQSQINNKNAEHQNLLKDGLAFMRTLFKKRPMAENSALKSAADDVTKLEGDGPNNGGLFDVYVEYFVLLIESPAPNPGAAEIANPYTAVEIKQLKDKIASVYQKAEATQLLVEDLLKKRKAKGGSSPEELANWREAEADEVGFEIYVKAGFKPDNYTDGFYTFLKIKEGLPGLGECQKKLDANQIPSRGTSTHPASCWRIYDIKKEEKSRHAKEYDSFYKTNTTVDLYPGRLKGIKQKLQ